MMRFVGGVLALCALPSCGSSPQSRFYALSPEQGARRGPSARVVEVREPSLPGYLDRSQLVLDADRTRIRYAGSDRWAEPLGRMLGRVLAANLRARLPDAEVFAESSSISLHADELVEVSIQRFDRDPDGQVSLVAQVAIDSTDTPANSTMRAITLKERESGGADEMVASMNRLVGKLADEVAELLTAQALAAAR